MRLAYANHVLESTNDLVFRVKGEIARAEAVREEQFLPT